MGSEENKVEGRRQKTGRGVGVTLLALVMTAGLAGANPIVITYISEFSTDPDTVQWIEFHELPHGGGTDMSGWQIITSTSACTLSCVLDSILVVDSLVLAQGTLGHGSFRLNPDSDYVEVVEEGLFGPRTIDRVRFPRSTASSEESPAPPRHGSASIWNSDDGTQSINWYVDSTPTPGLDNEHWSTITGRVLDEQGNPLDSGWLLEYVLARGPGGGSESVLHESAGFKLEGLNPGPYAVTFQGVYGNDYITSTYPESVHVGYADTTSGIDFIIDLPAEIRETRARGQSEPPRLRVAGTAVQVICPGRCEGDLALLDGAGRQPAVLWQGQLDPGVHRFRLPPDLAAGVYFARLQAGEMRRTAKVVVVR